MKKYKGYYIDKVIFNTEADIDNFIKEQAINAYRVAVEMFARHCDIEHSTYCTECAERLVKYHGMTWEEVEMLEIQFMKTA
jgi:hypothetical protein